MTRIIAIDPGTTQSGWVNYCGGRVEGSGVMENGDLLQHLREADWAQVAAIEMVASYGMAVGAEVFRTVWWTGRFADAWSVRSGNLPIEVFRKDVKLHLCGTTKAKDANIRAAILDIYGPGKEIAVGRKGSEGPLYGVRSHAWPALAVAITADALLNPGPEQRAA